MGARGRALALTAGGAAAGCLAWRWATAGGERHPAVAGCPLLISHRGGAGLVPENTLEAFLSAVLDWGADMVELDVHASADGECVVIHDPTVDRTTNGSGHVSALGLAELRELNAGYHFSPDGGVTHPFRGRGVRIPTIDEVLEALPYTPIIVEIKTPAAQLPLRRAIRRFRARDRVIVAGERDSFRTLFSGYGGPISASADQLRRFLTVHLAGVAWLARPGFDVVQMPEFHEGRRVLTPRLVSDLHRLGIPVHVWTVNDPADMHRLLDWGVDGILTDRPDLLSEVLQARVGRPPAPMWERLAEPAGVE